jgi:hypothetical protein
MTTDNPITPSAYGPTAAEVAYLYNRWQGSNCESARRFDVYSTAKAAHEAANDTRRILDEAVTARDAAVAVRAAADDAWFAAGDALIAAKDGDGRAYEARAAAYTTVRDSFAAVSAAREAHRKATA